MASIEHPAQARPTPARGLRLGVGAALVLAAGAAIGATTVAPLAGAVTSSGERAAYFPVTPCRLTDTRPAFQVGPRNTPLPANDTITIDARGAEGQCSANELPDDATALALNVTAVGATAPTFITIWGDGDRPDASALNPVPGQPPTPNAVTTPLSPTGTIKVFNRQGNVDAIIDVVGYYTDHDHTDLHYTKAEVDDLIGEIPTGGSPLFDRTVVVNGGGTNVRNGAALLAAVASITAATDADPWTVLVEPGTFDLGDQSIELPDHVSLVGAGRGVTVIDSTSGASVIDAGESSRIADMTINGNGLVVQSFGGPIRVLSVDDVLLERLDVTSTGRGIRVDISANTEMSDIAVTAVGYGVNLDGNAVGIIVKESLITSTGDSAVDFGTAGSGLSIFNSTLAALGTDQSALRSAGGSGNVLQSNLSSPSGGSIESSNASTEIFISQSVVVVDDPFGTHFTAGTARCTAISTTTAVSATTCI